MSDTIDRCPECGSWNVECGSAKPVHDCSCARCASARISRLEAAFRGILDKHGVDVHCHCPTCAVARAALAGEEKP